MRRPKRGGNYNGGDLRKAKRERESKKREKDGETAKSEKEK